MSDLIDRKQLLDELLQTYSTLNKMYFFDPNFQNGELQAIENVIETVKNTPTVNAVEVIRCKDCKRRLTHDCSCYPCAMPDNWFCKDGR